MRRELLEPETCGGRGGRYLTEHVHLLSHKLSLEGFWHQVIQTAWARLWTLFVVQLIEGRRKMYKSSLTFWSYIHLTLLVRLNFTWLCSSEASLACWVSRVSGRVAYREDMAAFLPASLYFLWNGSQTNNCTRLFHTFFLLFTNIHSSSPVELSFCSCRNFYGNESLTSSLWILNKSLLIANKVSFKPNCHFKNSWYGRGGSMERFRASPCVGLAARRRSPRSAVQTHV